MNCHIVGLHVKFERLRGSYSYVFWTKIFGSVCFSTIRMINCAFYQPVFVALLCLRVCVSVYICVKASVWYMFINNRKGVCVCLRVCAFVCVYELSEQEEWFHLDLIHLGGNLLVNRLVHELRRVHLRLLVCNIACGQFRFF